MTDITLAIKNCNIVLEDGIIFDGVLLLSGDRIAKYGKESEIEIPEHTKTVDAHGGYVGPGFVDLHVHGGDGKSLIFDTVAAADYYLQSGTTSILAAPWYKLDFKTFLSAIENVKEKMPFAKTVKGFYMEGPYTNQKYGSHAASNPWKEGIVKEEYRALVDAAGTLAKVWTIAPEIPGIKDFVRYAKEVNPTVVFAVGHSEASPDEIRALGSRYLPTLETHATNATGQKDRQGGIIGAGPDEYALATPEMYCELISDSQAIHVKQDIQRMLIQCKGVDKIVLITDGSVYNNPTPEKFKGVTDINFSPAGEVAGSKLTMAMACRNIMTHSRVGITEAFLMASRNPARVIGIDDEVGTIERGKRADLVIVDGKFNVQGVILGGEICKLEEGL